jgi:hypothetical protein
MIIQLSEFDSFAQEVMDENTPSERLQELAQLVATNPAAPPELLEKLSESQDTIILQSVTANPNTPTEVLWKLGEKFPGELLTNPIFSLLLLENLDFIRTYATVTYNSHFLFVVRAMRP